MQLKEIKLNPGDERKGFYGFPPNARGLPIGQLQPARQYARWTQQTHSSIEDELLWSRLASEPPAQSATPPYKRLCVALLVHRTHPDVLVGKRKQKTTVTVR